VTGLDASIELIEFALDLVRSIDSKTTAEVCASRLAESIEGAFAAVYLAGESGALALAARSGEMPETLLRDHVPGLVGQAFGDGTVGPVSLAEVERDTVEVASVDQLIAAPIASWEGRFGVVLIGAAGGSPGDEVARFVEAVADLTAASLANGRRLHATSAEARRDPLTGLGNRRAFHEHLDYGLEHEARRGGELTLVLFDLDKLKEINDSEGHLVGDRALRDLARLTLGVMRSGEEVFRLGGDEFAIVVEGGQEAGTRVAERVRRALARKRRGGGLPSISAGVATYPLDANDKEALIHKADLALYAAKERGKNRAVSYHSRLADETHTVHANTNVQREEEWWAKVLGLRTRVRFGDEAGPGGRPHDVALLAEQVAERLDLPGHARESIGLAAYLTELGKLRIPETIRRKRGPLSERDWQTIRESAEVMASTLVPIGYLGGVAEIVHATRERWDGNGYPAGLAAEETPLGARIVAVCEAYCALTTSRSYRPARSPAGALLELRAHAGTHFDPGCVEALAAVVEAREATDLQD
jgi:diguanylate cyclase (GGDEF)-like protein